MKALDCTTPRGLEATRHQQDIVRICAKAWQAGAICTPVDREAGIDALFHRDNELLSIAEVKWRPTLTLAQLRQMGSYLVTFDKLVGLRNAGRDLCARSLLIVGLSDDAIAYWHIADSAGAWLSSMKIERTATRATINGGSAVRANAYLSLAEMRLV